MANTLTLSATRNGSTLPVEFRHPVTLQYADGVQQSGGNTYQIAFTDIPAGQYGAGTNYPLICRLKGSSPAIIGTFGQTVTVQGATEGLANFQAIGSDGTANFTATGS